MAKWTRGKSLTLAEKSKIAASESAKRANLYKGMLVMLTVVQAYIIYYLFLR
jgi:hypothetical protein